MTDSASAAPSSSSSTERWSETRLAWRGTILGMLSAAAFIALGVLISILVNPTHERQAKDIDFNFRLARASLASIPVAGLIGAGLAIGLKRRWFAAEAFILILAIPVTLIGVFFILWALTLFATPLVLYFFKNIRGECRKRVAYARLFGVTLTGAVLLYFFGVLVYVDGGHLYDKLPIAAGLSIFITDLVLQGEIGDLERTGVLEPGKGFNFSLGTLLALVLSGGAYVTLLMILFKRH